MAKVGDVIGSYRLEAEMGAGAMGQVFKGSHALLGRPVAVKVLNDELAGDAEYVSRFFMEAKIVTSLKHPNIIEVYDYVQEKEPPLVAYVMEVLQGLSLNDVLSDGPLSEAETTRGGLQLVSALQAVHKLNVVHRDLKPENIFVLGASRGLRPPEINVKILDFGIAKAETMDAAHRTRTGFIIGTPAYMAPEQVFGEAVSAATDIYALGEILFEMVTGDRLFKGSIADIMRQKMERECDAKLPSMPCSPRLVSIIQRCIVVQPNVRPTLEEIGRELQAVARGEPIAQTVQLRNGAQAPMAEQATTRPISQSRIPFLAPKPRAPSTPSASTEIPTPDPAATLARGPRGSSDADALESGAFIATSGVRRVGPLAVIGLGLVLVLGAAFWTLRGDRAPQPLHVAATTPVPLKTSVALASEPTSAEVLENGRSLGLTPLALEVTHGSPRTFELRMEGYATQKVVVNGAVERVSIPMVRLEVPPTPPSLEKKTPRVTRAPRAVEAKRPLPSKPLRRDEVTPW